MRLPPQFLRHAQRGLSMIELMISVTIGLVIISAVGYLYVNSRGAFSTNAALARIQEDGRFGLDAILRDARNLGSLGCAAQPTLRSVAATALALPGDNGSARPYTGPGTDLFGVAPTSYLPTQAAPPGTFQPPTTTPAPPPWVRGDVLQMVVPTSKPMPLTVDADEVGYTVTVAANTANLQGGEYLVVSNCDQASITQVTSVAGAGPVVIKLTAAPLLPATVTPQMTLSAHSTAQQVDAVTYYVGQFPGRPWKALYRYSATYGTAEEIIDHVENMNVLYGVGTATPVAAGTITAANNWPNVTSLRVTLQVVGGDGTAGPSTAGANSTSSTQTQTIVLVPPLPGNPASAVQYTELDTRLRQVFTGTAALRNRNL